MNSVQVMVEHQVTAVRDQRVGCLCFSTSQFRYTVYVADKKANKYSRMHLNTIPVSKPGAQKSSTKNIYRSPNDADRYFCSSAVIE